MKILRILVPIDFTKESELALEWAVMVAQKNSGATVYLLHVQRYGNKTSRLALGSIGYAITQEEAEKKMKNWQERVPAPVLSFALYEPGRIPEIIAKVCAEKDIDLVIMTTRGRQGATRILEDSVTEETARLAPCPVLVLHMNTKTQGVVQKSA